MHLTLILFLPLLGAVAVALLPQARPALAKTTAVLAAVGALVAASPLWLWYDAGSAEFQFVERTAMSRRAGVEYFVGVDGYAVLLILLITLLAAVMAAAFLLEPPARSLKARLALMLVIEGGLLGAVMALDFTLFFLSWHAALAGLVGLAAIVGRGRRGFVVSAATCLIVSATSSAVAIGSVYLANHAATGTYTFDVTAFHKLQLSAAVATRVFVAFNVALVASVPLFVLPVVARAASRWPADPASTFAAALSGLATFGLLRSGVPIVPDAFRAQATLTAVVCLVGLVTAAVMVWRVRSAARAVAWGAVALSIFAVFGISSLNEAAITGSMIHPLAGAVAVAVVLLAVSATPARASRATAAIVVIALVSALVSTGTRMTLAAVGSAHPSWAIVAAVALAGVMARVAWVAWYGEAGPGEVHSSGAARLLLAIPLLVVGVWTDVAAAPILGRLKIAAHHVASHVAPTDGTAAECDSVPTPEQLSKSPGSQFLLAVPCGPDGQPLDAAQPASQTPP